MQFKQLIALLLAVVAVVACAVKAEETQGGVDITFFHDECQGAAVCFKCCNEHGHEASEAASMLSQSCVCQKQNKLV